MATSSRNEISNGQGYCGVITPPSVGDYLAFSSPIGFDCVQDKPTSTLLRYVCAFDKDS